MLLLEAGQNHPVILGKLVTTLAILLQVLAKTMPATVSLRQTPNLTFPVMLASVILAPAEREELP